MDRAVADNTYVGFRDAEKPGDTRTGLLVVEQHDDHRALAFFQLLNTSRKLFPILMGHG
jgi:hypothetical protein